MMPSRPNLKLVTFALLVLSKERIEGFQSIVTCRAFARANSQSVLKTESRLGTATFRPYGEQRRASVRLQSSPNSDENSPDEPAKNILQTSTQRELEDIFDPDELKDLEDGQPSEWMIMKELLGINIFTYILAGLIVIGLSLNAILGPGWLGSAMGLPGTGTFSEVSKSLPDTVDLSNPDFRF